MNAELKALEESLSKQFQSEITKIDKIRAMREEKKRDDLARQQKTIEVLLAKQAAEMEAREHRRRFWVRFILGPSGVLAATLAAVVGYIKSSEPTETDQMEKIDTVQKDLRSRIDVVEGHLQKNDLKIERTVDILLNQQVQQIDGHDQIVDMIEKAHPRTKRVPEPESLTIGRRQANRIKQKKDADSYDPANPLGDLQ